MIEEDVTCRLKLISLKQGDYILERPKVPLQNLLGNYPEANAKYLPWETDTAFRKSVQPLTLAN